MVLRLKLRRVGSSLGVILPKRELDARRLGEGDTVEIIRLHKPAARDLFGVWKEHPRGPSEGAAE